ncbi:MAG: hypothetical protein ACK4VW_06190 [Anaerolineales bacterium]
MLSTLTTFKDTWKTLTFGKSEIEYLQNYLFELEEPLTTQQLLRALLEHLLDERKQRAKQESAAYGKIYYPKERYQLGDVLLFPLLNWARGEVTQVRPGNNPALGTFEVIQVKIENDGERLFAASLSNHALNQASFTMPTADEDLSVDEVLQQYGSELEERLEQALLKDQSLVRIAGRWFPRALLIDISKGQLNLAEAVLDMAAGEPLPTSALLKDVELPQGVNPRLAEFSLNYALQEDGRFDEVGAGGQVLWCLRRLEPPQVQQPPLFLEYTPIPVDTRALTAEMRELEREVDDEWSDLSGISSGDEAAVCLIFPHWRAGTLPVSPRAQHLFPTAYESQRVRFTLVDARSGRKMPAWIVHPHRYVVGLGDWYKEYGLMPGSIVYVRRGEKPEEVIVEARPRRVTRDWVRTLMIGRDGGVVFATLKQTVPVEFNERMMIAVPDPAVLDKIWESGSYRRQSLDTLIVTMMRELIKTNPQGHVHAQEIYAAVNLVRRCPPAPLLAILASYPKIVYVGDLYFRLDVSLLEEL